MSSSGSPAVARVRIHELHGPVDDRQRPQPQEIELDEPDLLDVVLVELRDDAAGALFAVERAEIGQHRRGDHDAAGMRAGIARESLELLRQIDQVADLVLGAVAPRELRFLFQRIGERDAELERDQLRDAVDEAIGMAQHAPDVAHDGARRQRTEGDDLRHAVAPVAIPRRSRSPGHGAPCRSRCRNPASIRVPDSGIARTAGRAAADRGR